MKSLWHMPAPQPPKPDRVQAYLRRRATLTEAEQMQGKQRPLEPQEIIADELGLGRDTEREEIR